MVIFFFFFDSNWSEKLIYKHFYVDHPDSVELKIKSLVESILISSVFDLPMNQAACGFIKSLNDLIEETKKIPGVSLAVIDLITSIIFIYSPVSRLSRTLVYITEA